MYLKLVQDREPVPVTDIWQAAIPLKVRIFLWQFARGRLPSNDQIVLRHGPSDGQCALCEVPEDASHIFFSCALARFVWSGLREELHVSWAPDAYSDVLRILEGFKGKRRRVLRVLFAAVCWGLWLIRNNFTIERKFPNQPADCFFKILILLQHWRPLLKADLALLLDVLVASLKKLFVASNPRT